jgi:hypothetical protein
MVIFIEVRSHVRLTWLHPQGLGKGYGEPEGGRGRRGGLLAERTAKGSRWKIMNQMILSGKTTISIS